MKTIKKAIKYLLEKRLEAIAREDFRDTDLGERDFVEEMLEEIEE
jgi:hypothetical protein